MEETYGPQIDWDRYNELRDIQAEREFNESEREEFAFYVPIVKELDRQELEECRPALDRLDRLYREALVKADDLLKD